MSTLAERLKKAINARGAKMDALEVATGLGGGSISRLSRGKRGAKRVDQDNIRRLAEELRVPFVWLFAGEGPDPFDGEPQVDDSDPLPMRARVVAANRGGYPQHAIEHVRSLGAASDGYGGYGQYTWDDWVRELQEASASQRGKKTGLAAGTEAGPKKGPPIRSKR